MMNEIKTIVCDVSEIQLYTLRLHCVTFSIFHFPLFTNKHIFYTLVKQTYITD